MADVNRLLIVSSLLYDVATGGCAFLNNAGADPARMCLLLPRSEDPHPVALLEFRARGSSVIVGLGLAFVQLVEVLRQESVYLILLAMPFSSVVTFVWAW